ncbi:nucleoside phosphorylase [Vibrio sp. HN007]|uniref:nucleoside phosphorylase n=1 Tax=Vibrio iocasae TaxID=3098914 RepID=UPI0035D4E87D
MNKQPHICVDSTQVSEKVIVCGEPDRVNRIASLLEDSELIAENREYRLINGTYKGQKFTICSTGIGAPSMIIALEELRSCGAKYIIRVGSAGALQPNIALGDLILVEAAVRNEGGSKAYVSSEYPAISDIDIIVSLRKNLSSTGHQCHSGIIRSNDSFYTDEESDICRYWNNKGVLGADMETSALLTVGRLRGLKVASILNNVVLYEQDVKEGINEYVDSNDSMMKGEVVAFKAALNALREQS